MTSPHFRTSTQLHHADVLLITVTQIETQAVINALREEFGRSVAHHHIGDKTYYDLGSIDGAHVWLVRSEMGTGTPGGALFTVVKAIESLKPTSIVMIGIAFGTNPQKQRIGDVLVSRQLMLYDLQRIDTGLWQKQIVYPRGDRSTASTRLLDRFRHGALTWSTPTVDFGLILSGDKLVDNRSFRTQLMKREPEAIGGEMEGAGLYLAASDQKVDWILVKAICDWADGNKSHNKEQYQELAARNAARFTLHTLKQGGFVVPREIEPSLPRLATAPLSNRAPLFIGGFAPPNPKLLVGREDDLRTLKARLAVGDTATSTVQVLTAMRGWPGVGKTTIAAALVHDPELESLFPDGVLWVSLGQHPSLIGALIVWGKALGLPQIKDVRSIEEASGLLIAALRDRRCLLIVDDVWEVRHAEPFRIGGRRCAMLITTRRMDIAEAVAPLPEQIYRLDGLTPDKSFELLRQLAPQVAAEHEAVCRELVIDLEGLPLAIQVAGRLLHTERARGFSVISLLRDIRAGAKLIEAQPPADRPEVSRDTSATVGALLRKSTDLLDEHTRDCFAYMGVFAAKPATFDIEALKHMWMISDPHREISTLIGYGLLEPLENGRYWLHALLVAHAKALLDEKP